MAYAQFPLAESAGGWAAVQDISLADALCGCTFDVDHLDNRTIRVRSRPGTAGHGVPYSLTDNVPCSGEPLPRLRLAGVRLFGCV